VQTLREIARARDVARAPSPRRLTRSRHHPTLPRDIEEICLEVEAELALAVDRKSVEGQFEALSLWQGLRRDRAAARRVRAREMLLAGDDPYLVAESLQLDDEAVFALSRAIEAEGIELAWA
jgi:hypothetical protein